MSQNSLYIGTFSDLKESYKHDGGFPQEVREAIIKDLDNEIEVCCQTFKSKEGALVYLLLDDLPEKYNSVIEKYFTLWEYETVSRKDRFSYLRVGHLGDYGQGPTVVESNTYGSTSLIFKKSNLKTYLKNIKEEESDSKIENLEDFLKEVFVD